MADLIEISDSNDPRLHDYVALRDANLRRSLEAAEGLFIAEGAKVIRRAAEAGYVARSFMLAPRWLAGLASVLTASSAPVYVVSEALAESVSGFHVHRGALASFERQERWRPADLLTARRLVICEDIVDHTNVGAIIRCAAGLGWDGVLLAPRAADPLYRRAIKTSMGAVFSLPWARMSDWRGGLERLRTAGFLLVAMALDDRATDLDEFAKRIHGTDARIGLLLGTEGSGLSSHWIEQSDEIVRIPMSRGIDSLNVAAAAAVACYALR